jgi:hypothetical protein
MNQKPPSHDARILHLSRRKGMLAFGAVSGMHLLGIVVVTFLLMPLIYMYFIAKTEQDHGFWAFWENVKWTLLSIGYFGAALPYMALSIWLGRWAGRKILFEGKPYGLIGILAMQLPGICATICGICVAICGIWVLFIPNGNPIIRTKHVLMLKEALFYIPLSFYLPTFIMGIFGGLVTRQIGRQAIERLQGNEGE